MADDSGPSLLRERLVSLFTALQEQAGLKLDAG
jgi:hypothetical protein